jgi:hypothetical protein
MAKLAIVRERDELVAAGLKPSSRDWMSAESALIAGAVLPGADETRHG